MEAVAFENMPFCELRQEKEKWEHISLCYLLNFFSSSLFAERVKEKPYFKFINPKIENPIQRAIEALMLFIKANNLIGNLTIYDLSDYDRKFSFTEPPTLLIHQFSQALKAIHESPDTLEKYAFIGFNREQLEAMLDISLLEEKHQQMISEYQNELLQNKPTAKSNKNERQTDLQLIAILAYELAKYKPQIVINGKLNKSALSKILASSDMNYLFKKPKGDESYRHRLKEIESRLQ